MGTLDKIGYTEQRLAMGAVLWFKDGEKQLMICDWSRPGGETHNVVFFGDGEEIQISQDVILAIAETIKNERAITANNCVVQRKWKIK